jgi:hypothetical protein
LPWLLKNQILFVSWNVYGKSTALFKMHSVTKKPMSISKNNLFFGITALLHGITYNIYVNK